MPETDLLTRALILREITSHLVLDEIEITQMFQLDPAALASHRQALLDTGVVKVQDGTLLYVDSTDEHQARQVYAAWTGESACEQCSCTDSWSCEEGCDWHRPGLCTACTERDAP